MRRLLPFLLVACTAPTDEDASSTDVTDATDTTPEALTWDPVEEGPFRVGMRTVEVTYTAADDAPRTIPVTIWYPTEDETSEAEELTYGCGVRARDVLPDATPAAPILDAGAPVVAYSHGHQGWAGGGSSSFAMRHLASHGWVAVAPDHVGNMLCDNEEPGAQGHWYQRPHDIQAGIDWLADLDASDPLSGLADTSQYLMTGHSRGGTTVWSILGATFQSDLQAAWCDECSDAQLSEFTDGIADPRAVSGALLASGVREAFFGDEAEGVDSTSAPLFLFTGSEDGDGGEGAWSYLDGRADTLWVQLAGGCHETFAAGLCGSLDKDDGYDAVSAHLLAWGRRTLLDDDSQAVTDLLDGTTLPIEGSTVDGAAP